ncbi:hypothetical protein PITCH_A1150071 [uncultured Desulfobacterium sp.]|uniref:Response regulatory domain-containing protein n=1 Tax=uncultured Desulfobacterium sp. TaxID=201089 RepID=A0A445MRG1_9BACT|nr:hypothetical protein PITCH_A1150071 [uncultured Desulfobacterium sp.]
MAKKVLVIDHDREMLLTLIRDLEKYSRTFSTLSAEDGPAALEILKRQPVSLIVVALNLPNKGERGLLDRLSEGYPDIPAIIIAGQGQITAESFASEKAIAGYLERPFIVEDLAKKITAILKREAEGGVLHNIAPGTFLQLMEMESKTCTIRLTDEKSGGQGVLFFRDGEVLDARIEDKRGRDAAYVMLAWDEATLAIQELCPVDENKVQADLQALLLEAMRLKDEKEVAAKEKMTQDEIDEYIISVNQVEVVSEPKNGEAGTKLEEGQSEQEEHVPQPVSKEKRPDHPTQFVHKDKDKQTTAQAPAPPIEQASISYGKRDNIVDSISNLREALLESTTFTYLFRLLVFASILGLITFVFLYSTMESNQDILDQINHAKSLIKSRQDALTQLDSEIELLYRQKDEYFSNRESQLKSIELELKISELEDRQDKIVTEIQIQQKTINEAEARLESQKDKGLFNRLIEQAKKFFPKKGSPSAHINLSLC